MAEFRAACALFPTGVTVVTRRLHDDRAYGMTVSSFTSVSLEPPLVLVCIDKRAGFLSGLRGGVRFAINVLREDQEKIAVRFSRPPESNRFSGIESFEIEDIPVLAGTVAIFVCTLQQLIEAGDHFVLIGEVDSIERYPGRALVWCESAYHCLPPPHAD